MFVDIRKRLGGEEFDKFNKLVIEKAEQIKPHQARIKTKGKSDSENQDRSEGSSNKGTLKIDATVADQEIKYPTDLNLLNSSREILERIIDLLYMRSRDGNKPRTYRRKARKAYLEVSKKKRKSTKQVRKGIKSQLQYVARDLRIIKQLIEKPERINILTKRDQSTLTKLHHKNITKGKRLPKGIMLKASLVKPKEDMVLTI